MNTADKSSLDSFLKHDIIKNIYFNNPISLRRPE